MTFLLADVLEVNAGNIAMCADRVDRFVDCSGELRVENEIDFGAGVVPFQIAEELCEGGTEGVEVLRGPVAVLVFADGGSGPAVVGRSADENHIRFAETSLAGEEGDFAEIFFVVPGVADGGAGIGFVLLKSAAEKRDCLMPPGLFHFGDVVLVFRGIEVPDGVALRNRAFEG